MTEYLYRAFGKVDWVDDGWDRKPEVTVMVDRLPILRRTPAGAWIKDPLTDRERWVSTKGRKRFACPTEEEAIESLVQRNRKRRMHLENAMKKADAIKDAFERPLRTQHLTNGMYTFEGA